jgi:hypothetical protein
MRFGRFKRVLKLDRMRLPGPTGAKDELIPAQILPIPVHSLPCRGPTHNGPQDVCSAALWPNVLPVGSRACFTSACQRSYK